MPVSVGFPIYIDLKDNNCTVFGGGAMAHEAAVTLLRFHAKVTVISPALCDELEQLEKSGKIRYLRRKYSRGDCSSARICVAATNDTAINIAISDECKNKNIPVAVNRPAGFGTFTFPHACISKNTVVTVSGSSSHGLQSYLEQRLHAFLPEWIADYEKEKHEK